MSIHPAQLHALVRDRIEEIQRVADRHRLPAEKTTRVGVWRLLRRPRGTGARSSSAPKCSETAPARAPDCLGRTMG
jgi:hypothetical protein